MAVTKDGTLRSGVVVGYWDYLKIEVNPGPESVIVTLGGWLSAQKKAEGWGPAVTTTYSWSFTELTGEDRTLLSAISAALDAKVSVMALDNLG